MSDNKDTNNLTMHILKGDTDETGPAVDLSSQLGVTVVAEDISDIVKAERAMVNSRALTVDSDMFKNVESIDQNAVVTPTYDPLKLSLLRHENNTLSQCIHAMTVNIDGTGYEFVRKDGEDLTDADHVKMQPLVDFFDEVYPGVSFLSARKELRTNLEEVGLAYFEVLRDQAGEITFLKPVDSKLTRRLKENDPVTITRSVTRNGKEKTVVEQTTEPRFAMVIGKTVVYFRGYNSSRDLNAKTGKWAEDGETIAPEHRATELLEFTVDRDITTLYGVPRWINQLPSILGSRKAEEFNLDFFDRGGVPPAMILVSGGTLDSKSRTTLTNYMAGKATLKQRMIILEAQPSSGSLTSSGSMKISVERFGAERQNDSMFQKYDEATALHVRKAFRLPPLFLGLSEDYNFSTALASYMIAEAQVFKPERDEFDEIMNLNIVSALSDEYVLRSKPLSVTDVEAQLKGLELAKEHVTSDSFVTALNNTTTLDLIAKEVDASDPDNGLSADDLKVDETDDTPVVKFASNEFLLELASDWYQMNFEDTAYSQDDSAVIHKLVSELTPPLRKLFDGYVAQRAVASDNDLEGMADLLGCAVSVLDNNN